MMNGLLVLKFKQELLNDKVELETTEWQLEFMEVVRVPSGKRLFRFRVSRMVGEKRRGFRLTYSTRLHRCAQSNEYWDLALRFPDVWAWAMKETRDWVAFFGDPEDARERCLPKEWLFDERHQESLHQARERSRLVRGWRLGHVT